jgi:hypothetical protein
MQAKTLEKKKNFLFIYFIYQVAKLFLFIRCEEFRLGFADLEPVSEQDPQQKSYMSLRVCITGL